MKKILCIILSTLLILSAAACTAGRTSTDTQSEATEAAATEAPSETSEPLFLYDGTGAPPDGFGTPPDGFGTPPDGFGTPPDGFGTPPDGFGTPPDGFGTPPDGMGTPPDGFGGGQGQPPSGGPGGNPPSGGMPGGPGGSAADVSYSGATEITSGTTQENGTYASATADESALLISTPARIAITAMTMTSAS